MWKRTLRILGLAACVGMALAPRALTEPARGKEPQLAAHEDVSTRLLQKGLRELGAYQSLTALLSAGPRMTGSAQADAAVTLMVDHMKTLGFENVRTEPTTVSHWVRGAREDGAIVSKAGERIPVKVRAIGNSIATPADGITSGVIEVHSLAELETIGERASGRIVFFNGAMDPGQSHLILRTHDHAQ